jgi:hypothetical protein
MQISDMAHRLRAKELHSSIANFAFYDIVVDTEVDNF